MGIVFDRNRSGRTDCCTLSTVDTVCIRKITSECCGNDHFRATVCKIDRSDMLNLVADTDTVTTEDTFIRVFYDRF